MQRLKKTAKVIPAGTWPDSRAELREHWLSRPPAERVRAGRELFRLAYRRMHAGQELPDRISKAVRVLRRER